MHRKKMMIVTATVRSFCIYSKMRKFISLLMVLHLPFLLFAQQKITGNVVSESTGQVLEGVTIMIKGKTTGTVTDKNGVYSLMVGKGDILVFTYSDMDNKEVSVNGKSTINVRLTSTNKSLEDVVVVGYSSIKKKDLTGSVGQANVKDMAKAPVSSFAEAFAGRVAGVQVSSADGQPGGGMNIVIRGAGSLTQSTAPLYVIDGFPIEDLDPATLNPDDIESLTVLKDASSTAIYGSRGANGVVLIQTKRGKAGTSSIDLGASSGIQTGRKTIEVMSPYEFVRYQLERFPGAVSSVSYLAEGKSLEDYKNVKGIDFQDYVFTEGKINIYNAAMRGGTDKTRYSVSGSFFDQQGVIINTGLQKYTGRVRIDQTVSDKLKIGVTAGYTGLKSWGQVINSTPTGSASSYTLFRTWAYRPVQFPGNPTDLLNAEADESSLTPSDFRINPVIDLENQYSYDYTNLFEGLGSITYDITNNLVLSLTGGFRTNAYKNDRFFNTKTTKGSPYNPNNADGINGSVLNITTTNLFTDNTLTYTKSINNTHNFSVVALTAFQKNVYKSNGYSGRLLPNEELGIDGLELGTPYNPVRSHTDNTRASFGGRLDYNYKSKYLFTVNFRADGSSKFPTDKKWGYFTAPSVAWNIAKEKFLANSKIISNSKIRVSYGAGGNDRVTDYASFPALTYSLQGYSYNNATPMAFVYQSSMANPDLTWERTTSLNIGYDLGLFNNRIEFVAEVYKRTTDDLLLNATLPPTSGFGTAFKNIGKLENRGLELSLTTLNIQKRSFYWETSFNISFNQNKILALTEGQNSLNNAIQTDVNYSDFLYKSEIGKAAGMMVGYVWEGNYQYADFDNPSPGIYVLKANVPTNGMPRASILPGDIKYRDFNRDGVVNSSDRTVIGRGQPIHFGGLNNNFRYKNLSLSVFVQWAYGNDIYNANRITFEGNPNGRSNMNQYKTYVNRWSPENQTNENFRAGGGGVIGYHSSKFVEDGSYLRLKTVMLSYSVPSKFIKRLYMTDLSANVAVQNILTWTNYSGLDPEVGTRGGVLTPSYDYSSYPQARTITLGIKASF
ncbi:MAG TPA: TonB-dependent receptor [Flavitalea sp.]|nr:TonB-dependent receptor [Flavitalea sp.]